VGLAEELRMRSDIADKLELEVDLIVARHEPGSQPIHRIAPHASPKSAFLRNE
jgi:hypothetical protein